MRPRGNRELTEEHRGKGGGDKKTSFARFVISLLIDKTWLQSAGKTLLVHITNSHGKVAM